MPQDQNKSSQTSNDKANSLDELENLIKQAQQRTDQSQAGEQATGNDAFSPSEPQKSPAELEQFKQAKEQERQQLIAQQQAAIAQNIETAPEIKKRQEVKAEEVETKKQAQTSDEMVIHQLAHEKVNQEDLIN